VPKSFHDTMINYLSTGTTLNLTEFMSFELTKIYKYEFKLKTKVYVCIL
jgi:hypothetical protein